MANAEKCPEPNVTLYCDLNDRRTIDQKRVLAKALVRACCDALDLDPQLVAVRFRSFSYENMARGGVLLSDLVKGE
jgi:phenylpyruvate tautomerase PptA (4-oxalocrotonate tautomerase family)